jgi:hypothetical protein
VPNYEFGPIEAVAGVCAYFAALDDKEGADFVDPPCTRRRMID